MGVCSRLTKKKNKQKKHTLFPQNSLSTTRIWLPSTATRVWRLSTATCVWRIPTATRCGYGQLSTTSTVRRPPLFPSPTTSSSCPPIPSHCPFPLFPPLLFFFALAVNAQAVKNGTLSFNHYSLSPCTRSTVLSHSFFPPPFFFPCGQPCLK